MRVARLIILTVLSSSPWSSAAAPQEILTDSGHRVRVFHALTNPEELRRWNEETSPQIKPFLDFWEGHGARLTSGVDIYLEPESGSDKIAIYSQWYGPGLAVDLERLDREIDRVSDVPSFQRFADLVESLDCRYPPLFDRFAEKVAGDLKKIQGVDLGPLLGSWRSKIREQISVVMAPGKSIPGFPTNAAAAYVYRPKNGCQPFIVLGRTTDEKNRYHSFEAVDVVLHELGHGLHYDLWNAAAGGPSPAINLAPSALKEALADLFAHLYLKTPGHHPRKPDGGPQRYARVMNEHSSTIAEELWSRDNHSDGAAIRHFFWSVFSQDFSNRPLYDAFVTAIRKMTSVITQTPVAKGDPLDSFASAHHYISQNYGIFSDLLDQFCLATPNGTCGDLEAFLGKRDQEALALLARCAPSIVAQAGISTQLNGEPVTIRFSPGYVSPTNPLYKTWNQIDAEIESDNGMKTLYRYKNSGSLPGKGATRIFYLDFAAPGRTLRWRSDQTLLEVP